MKTIALRSHAPAFTDSPSIWPDPNQPAIIAPGPHRSYLDGPTLALLTPRPALFAVHPDFACHPVWRPLLLAIGRVRGCSMIPLAPGSSSGLRALLRHLQEGGWVCVFPSGGINTGVEHGGVAWLARRSGVPIRRLELRAPIGVGKFRLVTGVRRMSFEG